MARRIAVVCRLGAQGHEDDLGPERPKALQQALGVGDDELVDAAKPVLGLSQATLLCQQTAQPVFPRAAGVLHVHHHQRCGGRLQGEGARELIDEGGFHGLLRALDQGDGM